jgi:cell division protein FtsI (penicillin-binding protein 3)
VRTEPNGTLAASLLGSVNAAGVGSAGLEYQYQRLLAGRTGLQRVFASPSGVNLPGTHVSTLRRSVPGVGLELTIDTPLQFVTEQALAEQLRAVGGLTGTAIVMDVKTGQILADASLVNRRTSAGVLGPIASWGQSIGVPGVQQTINDLAFSQVYEPGSVFKIVPFSAALDAHVIDPSTPLSVPYELSVGGRTFHDADYHPTETLTATQVLSESSNIGTYEIASRVGEAGLLAQVERLGFGESTALDFPGESSGLLVNATGWYPSDLAALPIGQVDAVTPIQVLDAYNAIANGGKFVEPKLVRAYVGLDGKTHPTPPSVTHRALSAPVASTLNQMLQQVVLNGTGVEAFIPGYRVAGKTGTSQIPTPHHLSYIDGAYDASFVGFAPANKPVLSMIVLIQRPESVIFGGEVAAPVFQRVMSYALHHYGIAATGPTKPPAGSATSVASDVT